MLKSGLTGPLKGFKGHWDIERATQLSAHEFRRIVGATSAQVRLTLRRNHFSRNRILVSVVLGIKASTGLKNDIVSILAAASEY